MKLLGFTLLTVCLYQQASARPTFVERIPNGSAVSGVRALGHENTSGGGATNTFGQAFAAQGARWTPALCQADSDGDGATNGEELGDPCCVWQQGMTASAGALGFSTHPGVADAFSDADLKLLKCPADTGATDVTETPETTDITSTEIEPLPSATAAPPSLSSDLSGSSSQDPTAPEPPKPVTTPSEPSEDQEKEPAATTSQATQTAIISLLPLVAAAVSAIQLHVDSFNMAVIRT